MDPVKDLSRNSSENGRGATGTEKGTGTQDIPQDTSTSSDIRRQRNMSASPGCRYLPAALSADAGITQHIHQVPASSAPVSSVPAYSIPPSSVEHHSQLPAERDSRTSFQPRYPYPYPLGLALDAVHVPWSHGSGLDIEDDVAGMTSDGQAEEQYLTGLGDMTSHGQVGDEHLTGLGEATSDGQAGAEYLTGQADEHLTSPVDPREPTNRPRRTPRVRPGLQPSDPPRRLSYTPTSPPQTLGSGYNSGRNRLAIFTSGNVDTPRTTFPIRVERGRFGRAADARYPSADQILPGGLSLPEICAQYPNHVWGSMMRVFLAEEWHAERIWNALPQDVRHHTTRARPWNYIQQAIGREIDRMFFEVTGCRRVPVPREVGEAVGSNEDDSDGDGDDVADDTDGARLDPKCSNAHGTPQYNGQQPSRGTGWDMFARGQTPQEADLSIAELQAIAAQERERGLFILGRIQAIDPGLGRIQKTTDRDPDPDAGLTPNTSAMDAYRRRQDRWAQSLLGAFGAASSGEQIASRDPVEMLRHVWEFLNPWQEDAETLLEYATRSSWWAWRHYTATLQLWVREWLEEAGWMEMA